MLNTSSFGGGAGHTTFGSSSSNDFNKSALELLSTTAVPTFEVPESSYLSLFRKIMFGSSASSPLTEASSISSPLPSPPTPSSSSSSSSSKLDSVDVLIHLNVGGRYFPTMLSTLTAVAGSRFDEMFGGIKAHIFAQINPAPSSAAATTSSVLFASHGDEDIITKKSKSSLAADASRGGHGGEEVDNGILEERSFMSTTSTMYSNNNTPNIYNNNTVIIPNDDLRLPISADGCFFLDRDGTLFHYILHYLRHISVTNTPPQQQATTASHYHTPTPILSLSNIFITPSTLEKIQTGIIPLPPTQPELWALIRECKYFGLLELETICRQRLTEVRTREYAGSVYKAMMGPILEMVRLVLVNGVWILTMMETFLEVQGYTGYVKKRFAGPDVTDSSSVEVLTTTTSRFSNWGVLEYCLLRMMILVAIGTVFAFLYIYLL